MRLKDGTYRPGRFMGPGSHVLDRLREGQRGISPVDNVSARHDLAYSLAKDEDAIRAADEHMLARIKEIEKGRHGGDTKWNINVGRGGISSKLWLEDNLGVPKKWFTSFGDIDEKDRAFAQEQLDSLTQEGYGKKDLLGAIRANLRLMKKANRRAPPMPLSKAKSRLNLGGGGKSWNQHVAAYRKSHPGISYKAALKAASKTYKK